MKLFLTLIAVVVHSLVFGQVKRFLSKEDKELILSEITNYKSAVFYADSMRAVYDGEPFYTVEYANRIDDRKDFLIQLYTKANDFQSSQYCKDIISKLENLRRKEVHAELEKKFQEYMGKGDEFMQKKDYVNAKQFYMNAIAIKPNESTPQQRIIKIDQILRANSEQK